MRVVSDTGHINLFATYTGCCINPISYGIVGHESCALRQTAHLFIVGGRDGHFFPGSISVSLIISLQLMMIRPKGLVTSGISL